MKLTFFGCALLVGCSSVAKAPPPVAPRTADSVQSVQAASTTAALPFIEDNFARARAEAKRRHQPIFVDAWAPWCHACLSLRAFVFSDPALRARAKDFVWLAIDTERPQNDAFVAKFPQDVWPTLWVIDPETDKALLKWPGTATAAELAALLDDVTQHRGDGDATAMMMTADRARAAGDDDAAVRSYGQALERAPKDWPRRARVVEALGSVLLKQDKHEEVVALVVRELDALPMGTSRATALGTALEALDDVPRGSPARAHMARIVAAAEGMLDAPSALAVLADDRSGLFESLLGHAKKEGNTAAVQALAKRWAAMLEKEVDRAETPEARTVFDAHRTAAYIELGEFHRALEMLEQSARDFPSDYNTPARLARVYHASKREREALAAIDRALGLVYGPRAMRLFELKADILDALGDRAGAKRALESGVRAGKDARLPGRYRVVLTNLEKRLAAR